MGAFTNAVDGMHPSKATPPRPEDSFPPQKQIIISGMKELISKSWVQIQLATQYVSADNRRNPRSFAIGVFAVFLVATFLMLIQHSLNRAAIVFLKLAEDTTGQFDLLLSPLLSNTTTATFLNYTQVNASLEALSAVSGAAPRWIFPLKVSSIADTSNISISAYGLVIDTELEASIGLGAAWPYRDLDDLEVSVTSGLLVSLGLRPNKRDKIRINFDLNIISESIVPSSSLNISTSSTSPLVQAIPETEIALPQAIVDFAILNFPTTAIASTLSNATRQNDGSVILTSREALSAIVEDSVLTNPALDFTVVDAIENPYGKFPVTLGNTIVFEKKAFEALIKTRLLQSTGLPTVTTESLFPGISTLRLNDYALGIAIVKQDRISTYLKSQSARRTELTLFSNTVADALGIEFPATFTAVVSQALDLLQFIQIFLQEIFFTVIVVLVILAFLLIYSLLLADLETKTFEYGMLRTLGTRLKSLSLILVGQSLYFSIPALVIAFITESALYVPIDSVIANFALVPISTSLDTSTVVLGLILGIVLPLIGISGPLRRARTSTLRDALDIYHKVIFETNVTMKKLEKMGISRNESIFAILLVVLGFVIYYVVPLTFIFNDFQIFFRILTCILVAMVLGQAMVAVIVQNYFERLASKVVDCLPDKALADIVRKNLAGHLPRNRKTALMFTLCLAYIIFALTMFSLQADSFSSNLEWAYGADITVSGPNIRLPLPENELRTFLQSFTSEFPGDDVELNVTADDGVGKIVADFTFVTYPLREFGPVYGTSVSGLASISSPPIQIYGVEANFLDTVITKYYLVEFQDASLDIAAHPESGKPDAIRALYKNISDLYVDKVPLPSSVLVGAQQGNANSSTTFPFALPILLADSTADSGLIDVNNFCILQIRYLTVDPNVFGETLYLSKPLTLLRKMPAFPSIVRFVASNAPAIISMDTYNRLIRDVERQAGTTIEAQSGVSLPKKELLIKLNPGTSNRALGKFVDRLSNVLGSDKFVTKNLRVDVSSTQTAVSFILVIFSIVATIGIIFSFFVLWLSFAANIRENSWELGILRSIGLRVNQVVRIYLYEALCIMVSCIAIGTAVGVFTAIALTLQFNIFTEMPFQFTFPTGLYFVVTIASTLVALAGAYFPATTYCKLKIAAALKGTS